MIFSSLKRMMIYLFFQVFFNLFSEVESIPEKLNLFEGGDRCLVSLLANLNK